MSVEIEVDPKMNLSTGSLEGVSGGTGELAKTAVELWDEMISLVPPAPVVVERIDSRDLAAAREIVEEAIFAVGPSGRRMVPSAGAIFPYAILVLCRYEAVQQNGRVTTQAGSWGLFRLGANGSSVTRVPIPAAAATTLSEIIPRSTDSEQSYVLTLTRPWLSMRKYGPRGYLYSQVDAAHAAVNILGIALQTVDAALHVDPSDLAARCILADHLPFHELHSVLVLPNRTDRRGPFHFDVEVENATATKTLAFDFEAQAWSGLVDPLETNTVWSQAPGPEPVIATKQLDPSQGTLVHDWPELSQRRKSAKAFSTRKLTFAALDGVLESIGTPLPTNLSTGGQGNVELTVVMSHNASFSAAEEEALARRFIVRRMESPDHAAGIVKACMGQKHVAHAQVFLVLHSRRTDVIPSAKTHSIRRVLFRAGAAAQLAYLGAARYGIGVFTVGGFDARAWKTYAQIGPNDEVLCLLALGSDAAEQSPRADREEKATAHGE
ncbi:hypothetical protein HC749_14220 [Arthrobacter sp. S13_S34]|nr:hypothetical protein [Arthrobacter sp. S13_S34]